MKALSVWAPWAWALVAGIKPVENRGDPCKGSGALWQSQRGVWTLIHVGLHRPSVEDVEAVEELAAERGLAMPEWAKRAPTKVGVIVGAVRFIDDLAPAAVTDPWARRWVNEGAAHCWVVGEARLFEEHVPCVGGRGFFDPGASDKTPEAGRLAEAMLQASEVAAAPGLRLVTTAEMLEAQRARQREAEARGRVLCRPPPPPEACDDWLAEMAAWDAGWRDEAAGMVTLALRTASDEGWEGWTIRRAQWSAYRALRGGAIEPVELPPLPDFASEAWLEEMRKWPDWLKAKARQWVKLYADEGVQDDRVEATPADHRRRQAWQAYQALRGRLTAPTGQQQGRDHEQAEQTSEGNMESGGQHVVAAPMGEAHRMGGREGRGVAAGQVRGLLPPRDPSKPTEGGGAPEPGELTYEQLQDRAADVATRLGKWVR